MANRQMLGSIPQKFQHALGLLSASILLLLSDPSHQIRADVNGYPATTYYVSSTGNDLNNGTASAPLRTIQKAVDLAQAGQVIEVLPGSYPEKVLTKKNGTVTNPIYLLASNSTNPATLAGIEIRHSFFTLDGFSLDSNNPTITTYTAAIYIRTGVKGCAVLNNYIHSAPTGVSGILFEMTANPPAYCIVKNNRLTQLGRHMIMLSGVGHLIQNNSFSNSNGWDGVWIFGHDHIISKNFFFGINEVAGNGNHIDIFQGFDDNGTEAYNITFDSNFIVDSNSQLGQINNDRYSTKVFNWTISNNVFAKMNNMLNLNASIKGVRLFNNTLTSTGSAILGQISDNSEIHSNAFVGNSSTSSGSGWYSNPNGKVYPGLVWYLFEPYVTCSSLGLPYDSACQNEQKRLIKINLMDDLMNKGYLGAPNGNNEYPVLAKALEVNDPSVLGLAYPFTEFQDIILKTFKQAYQAKQTFSAHNNFVSGPAPTYAAKASSCSENYKAFNFCEPAGINGGDPLFVNISDPLGVDGLPFTNDDGLKPLTNSRLCAGGTNNTHIGAYPCSGNLTQAGAFNSRILVSNSLRIPPDAPATFRIAN